MISSLTCILSWCSLILFSMSTYKMKLVLDEALGIFVVSSSMTERMIELLVMVDGMERFGRLVVSH